MFVYVCIYVCVYVSICIMCIHFSLYTSLFIKPHKQKSNAVKSIELSYWDTLYMCVCVHVCGYVRTYACMYVWVSVHEYMNVCTCMYVCVCT